VEVIKEHKKGVLVATKEPTKKEEIYLSEYNKRLIKKLEKKVLDLEKSEKRIKYLYGVLGAIRGVNQLIVKEKNRGILIQKTCDVLIKARGYNTTWLGLLKDEKTFAMVVGAPLGADVSRFCEQVLRGDHPPCIKKALTKKDPFMFIDRSRDCGDCPLKKLHLGRNSLLIRIAQKSKLFGFLVLSLEPDVYIDQEEKGLLEEVTSDIAFGLYSIELEEQHKQAEEKYRTLYESSKDGIVFSDMEGNLLDANQAFLGMLGYSIEEIKRLTYKKITPKKWHEVDTDILKNQIMTRGYSKEFEKEFIKKDGTLLPIAIIAWLLKDKQGKPVGLWGIIRDIAERKKAIEEIEKLAKFPTENPNPVFRISKDGIVLYHNCASESLLKHWHYKEGKPLQDRWFQFVLDALEDDDIKIVETEIGDKTISLTFAPIVEKGFVNVYGLDITERKRAEQKLLQSHNKLLKTMEDTIYTIGKITETRDPYTAGHQKNVSQIATFIAQEMKLPKDKIEGIRIASLVHDIGKNSVPAEILNKPIKLSEIEFSLIKDHSQTGYDILKSIEFPWPVAKIVLQHHERLDGSGYPQGLKGDGILPEAKIIGVADVVEAMSSHRPYRPALGIDAALEEITQKKGILYDPEVVDTCIKLFKEKRI
jgi:PAS domain S-box-containing protein/putative nucleotidyltransferase with HDIG domain